MGEPAAKRALFEQLARIPKAASNPARLELLDLLAQGERSVEDLANTTGNGLTTVSAQLQELRRARLVETRRDGTRIYYHLAGDDVLAFLVAVRGLATSRLAEVTPAARDYLGDDTDVEAIDRHELRRRAAAGQVVVVDVRPMVEYEAGHIPGARSIPLDELDARLDELPADTEIVAYCRGPYCAFAHEAVRRLQHHGRRATRLDEGLPDWRLAGEPVVIGSEAGTLPRRPTRTRPQTGVKRPR
jgi:rhodanese-related sulfurtransferase/DNA-binding transcriptional ArsR family regulator